MPCETEREDEEEARREERDRRGPCSFPSRRQNATGGLKELEKGEDEEPGREMETKQRRLTSVARQNDVVPLSGTAPFRRLQSFKNDVAPLSEMVRFGTTAGQSTAGAETAPFH